MSFRLVGGAVVIGGAAVLVVSESKNYLF